MSGSRVNIFHYADDIALLAPTEKAYKCDTVKKGKALYFNGKIAERKSDCKQLHSHPNKLIGKKNIEEKLPQAVSNSAPVNRLKEFFRWRITIFIKEFTSETSGKEVYNLIFL